MAVDNSIRRKVVRFLKQLGLSDEQTEVYIFLLQHGSQTVLQISKGIGTGRTKLYPLLETLADKQLITIHERHYGTSYEAQPPEVLEFLVSEHERKASGLRSNLPAALHVLKSLQHESPTSSRIVEYRGIDGLKQMNWNLTRAEGEFKVFELLNLNDHLGKHFSDKLAALWAERHITSYDLTNKPDWRNDTGVIDYKEKFSQARYIDPKVFEIQFETYIYNNCVAILSYDREDIFGVEIYNAKLAAQQKQIFDLLWSQAQPIAGAA